MSAFAEDPVPSEPQDLGSRHLQEVLRSECFKRAPSLRNLLVYLWQNREKEISEYAIAVDALGRSRNFESRIDASVRVQISRTRQFLARYYESEGRHSTERLVIPMGTHQIQLVARVPDSGHEDHERESTTPQAVSNVHNPKLALAPSPAGASGRFLVPLGGTIIVLLVFSLGWFLWPLLHPGYKLALSPKHDLPPFWKAFMDNGKHTRIVLPTPLFFTWGPPAQKLSLFARNTSVNDFAQSDKSPVISALERKLGKPQPWRSYTVASDTFASLRLARFFDLYGVRTSISSATDSPQQIIDHENVIVFGTPSSMTDFQPELSLLSLQLGPYPYEHYVVDKRLPRGSPGEFPAVQESASRTIQPGIIALLPGATAGSRILIVQGEQTMALISYLISEGGMQEIMRARAEHDNTLYFEAVVLSEVNAGNPIQSRLVAFRAFKVSNRQSNHVAVATISDGAGSQNLFIGSAKH
jgi:hypothetical protein